MSDDIRLVWPSRGQIVRADPASGRPRYVAQAPPAGRVEVVRAAGDATLVSGATWDGTTNLLVEGDNADALRALSPHLEGVVDLVYVDPPFNSGSSARGQVYDNAMAHEMWLTMMEERLALLWRALRPGGSFYLHLDENEVHYAKVLLDDIAGRQSFVREIVWRIGWISGYKATQRNFVRNHDILLYYVKPGGPVTFEKVYVPYRQGYRRRSGAPSKGGGYPLEDTWNASANDPLHSIQIVSFSGEKTGFATQKNESLVDRVVRSSSREGDLVVDAFAGSGTTAAVCHKRGRRYVAVELDGAAVDLIERRLRAVVDGKDRHGITKVATWRGGGGFARARLAATAAAEDGAS
jgi:adenine-specific DNA-methyltransferase